MNEARRKGWDLDRTMAILLVMTTGAILIMASASGSFAQECHQSSRPCLTNADCLFSIEECVGSICLQRMCTEGRCAGFPFILCITGPDLPAGGCCAVCDLAENDIEGRNPACSSDLCVEGGTRCVECQRDTHCPRDQICVSEVCQPAPAAETGSVLTQHNDSMRTGAYLVEKQLTPAAVDPAMGPGVALGTGGPSTVSCSPSSSSRGGSRSVPMSGTWCTPSPTGIRSMPTTRTRRGPPVLPKDSSRAGHFRPLPTPRSASHGEVSGPR
jgi:hypothetical protein